MLLWITFHKTSRLNQNSCPALVALVKKVSHPSIKDHPDHELYKKYSSNGGASIFTFNIKGGRKEWKHIDNLKIFSLLAIVADEKIHPASTTHSQMSDEELKDMEIVQNILSISIGAEHIDDIITDLENGLDAIKEN